jgi:hypothetical protein
VNRSGRRDKERRWAAGARSSRAHSASTGVQVGVRPDLQTGSRRSGPTVKSSQDGSACTSLPILRDWLPLRVKAATIRFGSSPPPWAE